MNKTTLTPSQQPPLCHTHNGITMTRTFHPIGHGAFYTERFMQGGKYLFSAVFDCGCFEARKKGMSYAQYTNRINKAVDSAFSLHDKVDLLFISHFHADHINGIEYLTSRCDVKHIIVPQLTPNIVIEAYVFNYIQTATGQGDSAASSVNLWIRDLYSQRGNNNTESFPRVIEVMPAEEIREEQEGREEQERGDGTQPISYSDLDSKGGILSPRESIDYCPSEKPNGLLWRYIPFNPPCRNAEQLHSVSPFKEAVVNGKIDFEKLDIILKNTDIKKLKEAYKEAFHGNHNSYSMVVYSGIGDLEWYVYNRYLRCNSRIWHHYYPYLYICNCLYCGDFEANANYPKANNNCDQLRRFYGEHWFEVGILQVPHHGSEHNMNISLYEPEKVCIISAGETDKYGHPDGPVLEAIRQMNSIPIIVTENPKTKQEFIYDVW